MNRPTFLLTVTFLLFALALGPSPIAPRPSAPMLIVLGQDSQALIAFTDGDRLRLRVTLPYRVDAPTTVTFHLAPFGLPVAACTVARSGAGCQTTLADSLGWHWDPDGVARPERILEARANGRMIARSRALQVAPRPVVFVHGFHSDAATWANYLGPSGYLASLGLPAYAVGDGQVPGAMNTGHVSRLSDRTNTIAENASILADYIAGVKKQTGAQQVDVVAHSMGGLITRYYIDRVMRARDVGLFMTLGTPNGGTDCANLAASLGMLHPATLEIRPSYIRGIFNRQITRLHGVPYHSVAGTSIVNSVGAPCTSTPTDLFVSLDSAASLPVQVTEIAVLHNEMNTSPVVFEQVVKPFLQSSAGQFQAPADPVLPGATAAPLQFTRIITGHVDAAASKSYTIQLEPGLAVASFALFDVTRSLSVTVRGASGNLIALDPLTNGLVVVDDPATLVYLGYGFANPNPGPWQVAIIATGATPATGADFAITTQVQGGAVLEAQADPLLPKLNEPVKLSAQLTLGHQAIAIQSAGATIRRPDGSTELVVLSNAGDGAAGTWKPQSAGVFGIDLTVTATAPDGTALERTAFLAVQAQPEPNLLPTRLFVGGLALSLLTLFLLAVWLALWFGRRLTRRR